MQGNGQQAGKGREDHLDGVGAADGGLQTAAVPMLPTMEVAEEPEKPPGGKSKDPNTYKVLSLQGKVILAEITCFHDSAGLSLDGTSELQETPPSSTVILECLLSDLNFFGIKHLLVKYEVKNDGDKIAILLID